jgi:hypothetical protein
MIFGKNKSKKIQSRASQSSRDLEINIFCNLKKHVFIKMEIILFNDSQFHHHH